MTRRWPVAGVLFGVLWVFVRGPTFTASALLGQFLFGTVIGLPVAFIFRRLYAETVDLRRIVSTLPAVGGYLFVFAREVVVANVDVARRVLVPGMPIEPEVILVPLRVETDLGVTTIANSITVTPGTITLDHDPEENALYVHSIDGSDLESVVEPIRAWERYALVIFDEREAQEPTPEEREASEGAVRAESGRIGELEAERDQLFEFWSSQPIGSEVGPIVDYSQPYMNQWMVSLERAFGDARAAEFAAASTAMCRCPGLRDVWVSSLTRYPSSSRRLRNSQAGRAIAAANTKSGSSACKSANTPAIRRSPPPAWATASVVKVAKRPAPANTVGRYCVTDTAKPIAAANRIGRASIGSLTRQNTRPGRAPRHSAARG